MESQYTTHTAHYLKNKQTKKKRASPGFGICRVLRSDCLFPSMHFEGESTGNAIGSRGGAGRDLYGTVQATQTNPNTHICFNIKCTLNQTEKKSSTMHAKLSKRFKLKIGGSDRGQPCMTDGRLGFPFQV